MNTRLPYIYIFIIAVFIISSTCSAQDSLETSDFQTWLDFRTIYKFNDDFLFDGDAGIRGVISGEDWNRLYVNPSVVYYQTASLRYRGGIRFIYTFEDSTENTFEIRPWQGLSINWPQTSYFTINNYFRLEERFTFYSGDTNFDVALRLRYRIQAKTPSIRIIAIDQTVFFLVNFEIFGNLGDVISEKYVSRTRLTFGIGYYFTDATWLELWYTRQGSRRDYEEGIKTSEHIFRIRLRFKLN